jgi:hypothetical protein
MTRLQEPLAGNGEALEQAARRPRGLSDAANTTGEAAPGVSLIGAHVRHLLAHSLALVDGLAGDASTTRRGDARRRPATVERERSAAPAEVTALRAALDRVAVEPENREMLVNLGLAPPTTLARRRDATGAPGLARR